MKGRWQTSIFQMKAGEPSKTFFFHIDILHHTSNDYFLSNHKVEYYPPNVSITLNTIPPPSLQKMWLCPFKEALSWKQWGNWDGKDWACWRSKSGHIAGLKGVCVCVCVVPIDSQSMPRRPTLMGFLWLKKVKGEYNDIKTRWLHLGSDHSALQQLPDAVRLEGRKEKEAEKTREGRGSEGKAACWHKCVK